MKVHDRSTGTEPLSGRPYRANDPDSQLWIHVTGWHSVLLCYERYGPGRLSPDDERRYWAESMVAAELQTCDPAKVPRSRQHVRDYYAAVRASLAGPRGDVIACLHGCWTDVAEGSFEGGELVESPAFEAAGESPEGGVSDFEVEAVVGVEQRGAVNVEAQGRAGGRPRHQFEPDGDGGLPPEGGPGGDIAIGPVARPWGRGDPAVAVEFEAAGMRRDVPDGQRVRDRGQIGRRRRPLGRREAEGRGRRSGTGRVFGSQRYSWRLLRVTVKK